jgi:hypothetical protein
VNDDAHRPTNAALRLEQRELHGCFAAPFDDDLLTMIELSQPL